MNDPGAVHIPVYTGKTVLLESFEKRGFLFFLLFLCVFSFDRRISLKMKKTAFESFKHIKP